jgi:hypothetical protein
VSIRVPFAAFADVPQPHAAIHDEEGGLCPQEAHPTTLPIAGLAEFLSFHIEQKNRWNPEIGQSHVRLRGEIQ